MNDMVPYVLGFDTSILAGTVIQSSENMYARDFKVYLKFSEIPEAATDARTLARWRTYLAGQTSYSPNTINRMLSSVKTVMLSAEEQGYIPEGTYQKFKQIRGVKVAALKERVRQDARTRIDAKDMRRLTDTPDISTLKGLRDRAMLHTLASSGLRVSELTSLTPAQIVKTDEGYKLSVIGKNEIEPGYAPLSLEAQMYIEEWLAKRPVNSSYIFTSFASRGKDKATNRSLTEVNAWKIIKEYAQACGLRSIKPHDFRRFVGTSLAKISPRRAQKALRHKKISTTMDNYVLDDLEVGVTDHLY